MDFRALAQAMDETLFMALADVGELDGKPVRGMFAAPWLQPALGKLNTSIREPHFIVRDSDCTQVRRGAQGSVLTIQGMGCFEVVSIEPDGSGLTTLVLRERSTR
ncbi:head-tail joining protein [Chitinimonas sp. PSY-7]|uniref:head-tail joining protein n=1 Tax=Chitinimonas sp. PSY-7 TaxID=3459088 RepID=UPI00403FFD15